VAEDKTRAEAEEKVRQEAEENLREKAEAKAVKAKRAVEEKERRVAEEKAKKEQQAQRAAERKEAVSKARKEKQGALKSAEAAAKAGKQLRDKLEGQRLREQQIDQEKLKAQEDQQGRQQREQLQQKDLQMLRERQQARSEADSVVREAERKAKRQAEAKARQETADEQKESDFQHSNRDEWKRLNPPKFNVGDIVRIVGDDGTNNLFGYTGTNCRTAGAIVRLWLPFGGIVGHSLHGWLYEVENRIDTNIPRKITTTRKRAPGWDGHSEDCLELVKKYDQAGKQEVEKSGSKGYPEQCALCQAVVSQCGEWCSQCKMVRYCNLHRQP